LTVSLNDLLTEKDQETLAELLNGLITFDPEAELSRLFTPANLKKIISAGFSIRRAASGQGIISIEFDGGVCKKVKVTHSIE
jgi:hypothetical protein